MPIFSRHLLDILVTVSHFMSYVILTAGPGKSSPYGPTIILVAHRLSTVMELTSLPWWTEG